MRDIKEILNNPAILHDKTERFQEQDGIFQFKGFVKTKFSRKHVYATVKFSGNLGGWDHLSVSFDDEMPSWNCLQEMKEIFWRDDEVAIQIHPTKENYINNHPYCLHLWRPVDKEVPLPPTIMIGFRGPEHKEEDMQALLKMQEEIGSPMTRQEAEAFYLMTNPEISESMRNLNLAAEKGNVAEILKILGGKWS